MPTERTSLRSSPLVVVCLIFMIMILAVIAVSRDGTAEQDTPSGRGGGSRGYIDAPFVGNGEVHLQWAKWGSDHWKYEILRDGEVIATITDRENTRYRDGNATQGASHIYSYKTYNATGAIKEEGSVDVTLNGTRGIIILESWWESASGPYNLIGDVQVRWDARLNIGRDVVVNTRTHNFTVYSDGFSMDRVTFNGHGIFFINVNGFTVTNSTFDGSDAGPYARAITVRESFNGSIIGNTVSDYTSDGIHLWKTNATMIRGNNIIRCQYGIGLHTSSNNTITGNTVRSNIRGIYLYPACTGNTIEANVVAENRDHGIHLWDGSRNNTILGNTITSPPGSRGISIVWQSNGNILRNNTIRGGGTGIYLGTVEGISVLRNDLTSAHTGIHLAGSGRCTIAYNILSDLWRGVYLESSSHGNTIRGTAITNCSHTGLEISGSDTNRLENNTIQGNSESLNGLVLSQAGETVMETTTIGGFRYNFGVGGTTAAHYRHTIDPSCTVDGRPIRYWVGRNGGSVPKDAGYVGIAECTGVSVDGVTVTGNSEGILIAYSSDCWVTEATARENEIGIRLYRSDRTTIRDSNASGNHGDGIFIRLSHHTIVTGTRAGVNRDAGISILDSNDCSVHTGIMKGNHGAGVYVMGSRGTLIAFNAVSQNAGMGIVLSSSPQTGIANNTVTGHYGPDDRPAGIAVYGSGIAILKDNIVHDNENGIFMGWSDDGVLRNNSVQGNNDTGIEILSSRNTVVERNNVTGNGGIGVMVNESESTRIENNTLLWNGVEENGTGYGLVLILSDLAVVRENIINGNHNTGIMVYDSGDSRIINNIVQRNGEMGINFTKSGFNTILGNNCSYNGEVGMFLDLTDFTTLEKNEVFENGEIPEGRGGGRGRFDAGSWKPGRRDTERWRVGRGDRRGRHLPAGRTQ